MRRNRAPSWSAIAGLCSAVSLGQVALADNSYLTRARTAYEQLDYDKVAPLLEMALEENNSVEDEIAIYELLGLIHVTYGRDREAQEAFIKLLERRPDYVLSDDSSPKIVSVFQQAREEYSRLKADTPGGRNEDDLKKPPRIPTRRDAERGRAQNRASPEDSDSFYTQWWFWTGAIASVGVSSVVAGVLIWALTRPVVPETDFGPYPIK
ncbi:MAG: hypothetical protein JXR83_14465 [Deltaproteobacteria bacterium]|nr:hypothetical protein [Deltaproteobacteria bacterium]